MTMRTLKWTCALATAMAALAAPDARAADSTDFRVGAADKDITPPPGIPMWGYGARHDLLSQGALDPLMAKAIVIAAGDDKVALVGIDLGRGPTEAMMKTIRRRDRRQGRHPQRHDHRQPHAPRPGHRADRRARPGQRQVRRRRRLFPETAPAARRSHSRRRQGAEAGEDRSRDRVGSIEPQPAHQARAQGHRSHAGGRPLRRPGGQADRRPRQLRRAPGHDRGKVSSSTRPTTRVPQEQGGSRAGHQVRLHARALPAT